MLLRCRLFRVAGVVLLLAGSPLLADRYEQRFTVGAGLTAFGDGSTLSENFSETGIPVAGVIDASQQELQLTSTGVTGTRSIFSLPALSDPTPITAFSARWNSQVYGSSLADGLSLTLGNIPADATTNAYRPEDGFGSGLTIGVRTFTGTVNGQPNNPGIRALVNGNELAYSAGPVWGSNNSTRHYWEVDWSSSLGLSVRIDGLTYLNGVQTTGFTPTAGMNFAFAARTGGFTEEVRLDNVAVVTAGILRQVPMSNAFASSENGPNETAAKAFDGKPAFTSISSALSTSGTDLTKWLMFDHAGTIGARTADGQPHTVTAYTLVSGNDNSTRYPRDWTLEGSVDGTHWNTIDQVAGEQSLYGTNVPRTYLVDDPGAYSIYRLNITENNRTSTSTAGITQLDEIILYETTDVPEPSFAAIIVLPFSAMLMRRTRAGSCRW